MSVQFHQLTVADELLSAREDVARCSADRHTLVEGVSGAGAVPVGRDGVVGLRIERAFALKS